ncbi:putative lipoprotein [Bordetella pertussis]|nr:putative lipoprotein [Bordetella pertussis]
MQSNGEPVDASDPIYQNRYRVEKVDSGKLTLRELKRNGQAVTARRMQPGYRLPY